MLVIPALGRQGQVDFWSQLASLPSLLAELQNRERSCLKN